MIPSPLATPIELLRHYGSYVGVHGRDSPLANFIYESAPKKKPVFLVGSSASRSSCDTKWENERLANDSIFIRSARGARFKR